MAKIIDGKQIAKEIRLELKQEIEQLKVETGIVPGLAVVLVGDDPASATYVRMKGKACKKLGLHSETIRLPQNISRDELLDEIEKLKCDSKIHGILVQLPLPNHIQENVILEAIPPEKDVDGFHPINKGKLLAGEDTLLPCTPAGVQEMLIRSGNNPAGKHVVILGRSQIVGIPLGLILMQKQAGANATVTLCHTGTKDIAHFTRQADIVVAAMGRAEIITGDMLRKDAVVIDVGTNRVDAPETERGYRLTGDVDFTSASQVVRAISPVPGGVGPMTIVMLMKNTVKAARLQQDR